MRVLAPIFIAFSMFSRLPSPGAEWNDRNMRYALCAFPLVGLVQGGLCLVFGLLAAHFSLGIFLTAAVFTLLPLAINGGIHLDGLADTADAQASHASRERKLEILKDPHLGAFGAMALFCHLLLTLALFTQFLPVLQNLLALCCIYIQSRALSGYAVITFPPAKADGTARSFGGLSAGGRAAAILLVTAVLAAGLAILCRGFAGGLAALAGFGVFFYYRYFSQRQFGGVTGDLAGWFLQNAELWMLAALVLGGGLSWFW